MRVVKGVRYSVGRPLRNKHEVGEEGEEDASGDEVMLFEWEVRVLMHMQDLSNPKQTRMIRQAAGHVWAEDRERHF